MVGRWGGWNRKLIHHITTTSKKQRELCATRLPALKGSLGGPPASSSKVLLTESQVLKHRRLWRTFLVQTSTSAKTEDNLLVSLSDKAPSGITVFRYRA